MVGWDRRPKARPEATATAEDIVPDIDVNVRTARSDDIEHLARLHEGHALFRRYALDTPTVEAALSEGRDRGDSLVMAERAGVPVGFAWWLPHGAFARSPYLRLLVVASGAAGRGIGARLMDVVETAAFGSATDLFLLVTSDNDGARRFYERRGFETIGVIPGYVVRDIDEVLMRKRRPA
jgi:ribosomal protein S18 acetylase RimI-like enzyme